MSLNLPLLPGWAPSPAYFAVILYMPIELGVNVTEQLAEEPLPESVHFVELNVPGRLLVNLIFHVGVAAIPAPRSVTVAVHLVGEPTATDEGTQLTDVMVAERNPVTRLLNASVTQRLPDESNTIPWGPFMPVEVVAAPEEVKSGCPSTREAA